MEAAAAAFLGKSAFDYNRENFFYDRELRLKKEFRQLGFRVIQSQLWRQDIRDIISLVELKAKKYLLVNVLMLGFTVSLWVQGTLPDTTPDWLMLGNQVAIGGAFTFLLLTVWLAMHASISAQGFQARLLTQLVRFPIPTWEELEACRSYGSSFEKVEARQMFRVPFAMGRQENLVPEQDPPQAGMSSADLPASGGNVPGSPASGVEAEVPSDPWGLESRGDQTYELGCPYNKDCADLRHIRLVRQAQQFWLSYDAFARISMSIGVNQLMLAMSYYILGYVLVQASAPWPAFAGVVALVGLAQIIAVLDMSIGKTQQFIITVLVVSGPSFACVACYHWNTQFQFGPAAMLVCSFLAPAAFLSHGALVLFLSYSCRLKETIGGGLLPTSFKKVLYLDVFGWTSRKTYDEQSGFVQPFHMPAQEPAAVGRTASKVLESIAGRLRSGSDEDPMKADLESNQESTDINHYALDYMEPPRKGRDLLTGGSEGGSDDEAEVAVPLPSGTTTKQCVGNPALQAVSYDAGTGQSFPMGVRNFAPPSAHQDLRYMPGAPHQWEPVSLLNRPKEFFDSASFYPEVGTAKQMKANQERDARDPIVSGHDHELPGTVPWRVFMFATVLLGTVWILAAIYQFLCANAWMKNFTMMRIDTRNPVWNPYYLNATGRHNISTSLLQWSGFQGGAAEQLDMSVPFSHIVPKGFSCDATGQHFAITDGISTFVGEAAPRRTLRRPGLRRSNHAVSVEFREVTRCASLLGEALQDTAIACGGHGKANSEACEVLLLHHRGKRVASCPVANDVLVASQGNVAAISQRWLRNNKDAEKTAWLLLDSDCVRDSKTSSGLDCASVGTTHGRVAHLQHSQSHESSAPVGALFPDIVMPDGKVDRTRGRHTEAQSPGMVRSFNSRYLGVLQRDHNSIRVLDASKDLAEVGTLKLPSEANADAFCAGGGHVYMLSRGSAAQMWRVPLPEALAS